MWKEIQGRIDALDNKGRPSLITGTLTDINKLRELELNNRRLQTIIDASTEFISTASPSGEIQYMNPASLNHLGFDQKKSIHGLKITDLHPEDTRNLIVDKALPSAMSTGVWHGDTYFINKNGDRVEVSEKFIIDRNKLTGEIDFITSISKDISETKKLEVRLDRQLSLLEEMNKRKSDFISVMAHELRNPLAPIGIAAHLLMEQASNKPELIKPCVEMISRQFGNLKRLVDDLLDIARIDTGKIELRRADIEVGDLINMAVEISRPNITAKQQNLSINCADPRTVIHADKLRLTQVISNILNNASKFTQEHGEIALSVNEANNFISISIKDNGIGIDCEHINDIFNMYKQVGYAGYDSHGGMGIGLYLAHHLVLMMGGDLAAKSEGLGHGSEFSITMPVNHPLAVKLIPRESHTSPAENKTHSILVVDDNKDAANSLEMLLMSMGHKVSVAYSGMSALEIASHEKPEIIFMDIGMPDINGYEVCRRIKKESWGKAITIVAVTGWGQEKDINRTRSAGFEKHLTKPIEASDIKLLLHEIAR